ncbi:MAG TPA: outer membrane beta-barrel protein [Longimicrobiales bacterium]|nr:outer membrane beta-barrel protein [Longimicrobiales bacterium]
MRRPLLLVLLSTLIGTGFAVPASAQEISSPYRFVETRREIALYSGWMSAAEGRFGYGPQAGPTFGMRLGVSLAGPLELEADLGWSSLERDVIDPTGEDGPSPVSEADVGQYHALIRMQGSIVGRRTWNGLQPVVWAGLGLRGDFRGTQTGDLAIAEQYRYDTGTKFAATFGGMIRFIVADRWSARLEAGALLYRLDTPGGYSEEGLGFEAVGENEWVNAPSFGLSLGYRF